uniref:Transmembrane protein n=1 Tax=Synechococcus elongatus (strain ATCC 33912 / PCC 7942 / FACHB-805) TaxID=1140 RepID=Q8GMS8_SYNE7|nr:hypothetical protein [Synechococcus elongatus PCC 7942 = FACHB-805]
MISSIDAQSLLDFWFGKPTDPEYGLPRSPWFQKSETFDAEMRDRFLGLYEQVCAKELIWRRSLRPAGTGIATVVDQVPRNCFRDRPEAFATDPLALAIANHCLVQGWDQQLLPVQRWFVYLPLEHSENLADQDRAVALFEALGDDPIHTGAIAYAHQHHEIIARFGRFPHRNEILGRSSTPEELAFLQQPGSRF